MLPLEEVIDWHGLSSGTDGGGVPAVVVVEEAVAARPDELKRRLRQVAPSEAQRCRMRRRARRIFEQYFATMEAQLAGLVEVLEQRRRSGTDQA